MRNIKFEFWYNTKSGNEVLLKELKDFILSIPIGIEYLNVTYLNIEIEDPVTYVELDWLKFHSNSKTSSISVLENLESKNELLLFFIQEINTLGVKLDLSIDSSDDDLLLRIYSFFKSLTQLNGELEFSRCLEVESLKHYEKIDAIRTPSCFAGKLGWFHLLSKSEYEEYYSKDVLLKAPVFKVEEWENESIFFQCYENPFEFEKEEERIIAISKYLKENENELEQL
jgi:hypothetical protein